MTDTPFVLGESRAEYKTVCRNCFKEAFGELRYGMWGQDQMGPFGDTLINGGGI